MPMSAADPKSRLESWLAAGLARGRARIARRPVALDRPKQAAHGDYATNVALQLAKALGRNPREFAQALVARAAAVGPRRAGPRSPAPGSSTSSSRRRRGRSVVAQILARRGAFGRSDARRGEPVMVEFVSANPTGPLHVGHGRQAALGDAIATLLEWQGAKVDARVLLQRRRRADREPRALGAGARARAAAASDDVSRGRLPRRVHPRDRARLISPQVGHDLSRPRGDPPLRRRRRCAREQDLDLAGVRRAASTTTTSSARSTPTAGRRDRRAAASRRARPTSRTARCG